MADIDRDPSVMSPDGHTEPLSSFKGATPPEPGQRITVGPAEEVWEVVRIDPAQEGGEAVLHIRHPR